MQNSNTQSQTAQMSPERLVGKFWDFLATEDSRSFAEIVGFRPAWKDVCMVFTGGNATVPRRGAEVFHALRRLKPPSADVHVVIIGLDAHGVNRQKLLEGGVPERLLLTADGQNAAEGLRQARVVLENSGIVPSRVFIVAEPFRTRRYAALAGSGTFQAEIIRCPPQGDAITTTGLLPPALVPRLAQEVLHIEWGFLQGRIKGVIVPRALTELADELGVTFSVVEGESRTTYLPGEIPPLA